MQQTRDDLIYKDECYKIVGVLIEVFKQLGSGYQEKYYQKAIAKELTLRGHKFVEQAHIPLEYKGEKIGSYFVDFIVEINDIKIPVEIKRDKNFSAARINQLYDYLKVLKLNLGILANFTREGVRFKRIVNQ